MSDNMCTRKLSLAPLSHLCEFMCMMLFSEVDLFEAPGLTQRLSCYVPPRSGAGFIEGSHESGWLCHGDLWVMNPGCCARNSPAVWGLLFLQDGNERAAVRAWGDVGGVSLDSASLDFLLVFYLHVVNVSTLLKLHGCSYAYPGNVFIALLDEACGFLSFWKWHVCFVIPTTVFSLNLSFLCPHFSAMARHKRMWDGDS